MWNNLVTALKAGSWAPTLNSAITIAATIGLVTTDQASAITAVVAGAASLVSLVVAAIHTIRGVQLAKAPAVPRPVPPTA